MNNITVTEDQLFWMFRYCITRNTYAALDGVNAIVENWKFLSKHTKNKIVEEINEVLDNPSRYTMMSFMFDSDKEAWQRVLALDQDEKSKERNSHE